MKGPKASFKDRIGPPKKPKRSPLRGPKASPPKNPGLKNTPGTKTPKGKPNGPLGEKAPKPLGPPKKKIFFPGPPKIPSQICPGFLVPPNQREILSPKTLNPGPPALAKTGWKWPKRKHRGFNHLKTSVTKRDSGPLRDSAL